MQIHLFLLICSLCSLRNNAQCLNSVFSFPSHFVKWIVNIFSLSCPLILILFTLQNERKKNTNDEIPLYSFCTSDEITCFSLLLLSNLLLTAKKMPTSAFEFTWPCKCSLFEIWFSSLPQFREFGPTRIRSLRHSNWYGCGRGS